MSEHRSPIDPERPGRRFRRAFSSRSLLALAGRISYQRGTACVSEGQVVLDFVGDAAVTAVVRGRTSYQVRLALDEEDLPTVSCSCQMGAKGRFCKHLVAAALVATSAGGAESPVDLAGYLAGLGHGQLVDLLLERAAEDNEFGTRLEMAAARAAGGQPRLGAFRDALEEAFAIDDCVGYHEAHGYISGIGSVLDSLGSLLNDGHGRAVLELCEYAIDLAEDACAFIDDSDGGMSGIGERLRNLHHDACAAAELDPVELAGLLYDRERTDGDLEIFYAAAACYADLLGEAGLAEFRRLAQAEWNELPALGPNDAEGWDAKRHRITSTMETLARISGDPDELIAVLAKDLSTPYQFVRIAGILREAGRHPESLDWAERGLAVHGPIDGRLVEIAAEEYHAAGRHLDAVQLAWEAYERVTVMGNYKRLADHAARAGDWPAWQARARDVLGARIVRDGSGWAQQANSLLVEVLLFDGEPDAAWAAAEANGCRPELWLRLAALREAEHPLDAIPIWQGEVARQIETRNNHAYAKAVDLIDHVGRLMVTTGDEAGFASYVAGLRAAHKPKRNLMRLFAERGWVETTPRAADPDRIR